MYAIGVFLSFTLSQAGMAKHHIRKKEPHWRTGIFVNSIGAVLSLIVLIVFAVTKFTHGAWFIILLVPILVTVLVRLNRQYESERVELEADAEAAASAPIMRRHVALVFINQLDSSAARAIQYAAVAHARRTAGRPHRRGSGRGRPPPRPLERAGARPASRSSSSSAPIVAWPAPRSTSSRPSSTASPRSRVLLPRRVYRRRWHSLLHDRTAERISLEVGRLPHANVTTVPFQFERVPTRVVHDPSAHSH